VVVVGGGGGVGGRRGGGGWGGRGGGRPPARRRRGLERRVELDEDTWAALDEEEPYGHLGFENLQRLSEVEVAVSFCGDAEHALIAIAEGGALPSYHHDLLPFWDDEVALERDIPRVRDYKGQGMPPGGIVEPEGELLGGDEPADEDRDGEDAECDRRAPRGDGGVLLPAGQGLERGTAVEQRSGPLQQLENAQTGLPLRSQCPGVRSA
jgi:hypothetical protein